MVNPEPILKEIEREVHNQLAKWGVQNHDDLYWLGILVEEVGEAAKAAIEFKRAQLRKELIHVAAVTVSWIDCYDRRARLKKMLEGK